jgi:NMD protein affecting ribosome stability and mRNA decay
MAINNRAPPDRLTRDRLEFKEFHNLLAKGQYKKLAALLLQLKATCQQNEDKVLADILAAAYQICSACGQSRAEVAWYEHATQEAHQREQELKQELFDILGLISKQVVHEIEKKGLAVPPVSTTEVSLPEHVTSPLVKRPACFNASRAG